MSQFIVLRPAGLIRVFARLYRHDLQEWFAAESVERARLFRCVLSEKATFSHCREHWTASASARRRRLCPHRSACSHCYCAFSVITVALQVRGTPGDVRGARGGECARAALRAAVGAGADGTRLRRQRRKPAAERNARVAPARISLSARIRGIPHATNLS